MLSKELLEILACPVCKGTLQTDKENRKLTCIPCRLQFQVKEGIPVMLADDTLKSRDAGPGTGN
jgi:uncharacterized protein